MNDKIKIEDAIDKFYTNNNIKADYYTDSEEDAYLNCKSLDAKISFLPLQENVKKWIQEFDKKDREYFLKLLENFTYITKEALLYRVHCLCQALFQELEGKGIDKTKTLFVARESPGGIKSGADEIVVNLWQANMRNLGKNQIITSMSRVDEDIVNNAQGIIFIDDILGTGFTMREQMEEFFEKFKNIEKDSHAFYFTGLLATRHAIKYIKKYTKNLGFVVSPFFTEEQMIRSAFKGDYIFGHEIVKEVEKIVEKYEDVISAYENDDLDKTFAMGFGRCKLLLAFHYETPNNTLCSFWKATDKNHPVFVRSGYARPSVDDLKKRDKHMQKNAYEFKVVNRGVKR